MMLRRLLLPAALLALSAIPAAAQSRSRISVQLSGVQLTSSDVQDSKPFMGYEGQVRYTFGRLSVGLGAMQSSESLTDDFGNGLFTLSYDQLDIFLEPRYVVAAFPRVGLYVAGRLGVSKLTTSLDGTKYEGSFGDAQIYGGGGGVLIKLTDRISGDIGAQVYVNKFNEGQSTYNYTQVRAGLSFGL